MLILVTEGTYEGPEIEGLLDVPDLAWVERQYQAYLDAAADAPYPHRFGAWLENAGATRVEAVRVQRSWYPDREGGRHAPPRYYLDVLPLEPYPEYTNRKQFFRGAHDRA